MVQNQSLEVLAVFGLLQECNQTLGLHADVREIQLRQLRVFKITQLLNTLIREIVVG